MDGTDFAACCKVLDYLIKNGRLITFDPNTKALKVVKDACINGNDFQLNLEKWDEGVHVDRMVIRGVEFPFTEDDWENGGSHELLEKPVEMEVKWSKQGESDD